VAYGPVVFIANAFFELRKGEFFLFEKARHELRHHEAAVEERFELALRNAEQALRRGDWTAFGRAWAQLKSFLEEK